MVARHHGITDCASTAAVIPQEGDQTDRSEPDSDSRFDLADETFIDRGEAGASSARRYRKLHEQREAAARDRLGPLAGVYLALTEDPQSTTAWAVGSDGEHRLGRYLETLHDDESIVVLHDRRIPGSRANIDHIVVAPTGVYVIDAKNYKGRVQRVDKGRFFATEWHLYVGRRDCTKLVTGMGRQLDTVRSVVDGEADVRAAICFVAAEWSLLARPFEIGGVWVGWAKALGKQLSSAGPLETDRIGVLARRIANALPSA